MRIYFDDQIFINQNFGGIKTYFTNLIKQFIVHPEFDVQPVLSDFSFNTLFKNKQPGGKLLKILNKYKFRNNYSIKEYDAIHYTYYFKNYLKLKSSKIQSITTIHDMIPEKNPEYFFINPHFSKKKYILESSKLICVSENTKNDLILYHPKVSNKIVVTYLGSDNLNSESNFLEGTKYLIYVGKRKSYKSIDVLYSAFSKIIRDYPVLKLVLVGGERINLLEKNELKRLKIFSNTIHIYPDDAEMLKIIKNSHCLVCTSLDEGFHLPTLQALSLDIPVVVRDLKVFKELYGNNIFYFCNESELIFKIKNILDNKIQISSDIKNVLLNYTWYNCAKKTSELYHK